MPELPFNNPQERVRWCAHWVEIPAWWLRARWRFPPLGIQSILPSRCAGFLPVLQGKVHLGTKENDYALPPVPHCIVWDTFLPQTESNFTSQDYRLRQSKTTLVLTKSLQFWVEKALPTQTNRLCQLAACVRELREAMEPLTSFTDEDILVNDPPSLWKKITSLHNVPREGEEETPGAVQGHEVGTLMQRAHPRGSFQTIHSSRMSQAPHHPHEPQLPQLPLPPLPLSGRLSLSRYLHLLGSSQKRR